MSATRLRILLESGEIDVPKGARLLLFGPRQDHDLSALTEFDLFAIQGFRPDFDALAARGINVGTTVEGRCDAAIVFLPRSKPAARQHIARARQATDGPVIVDGHKTDGIESILRDLRKRADVTSPVSKAHGKCFAVHGGDFDDWLSEEPTELPGGFKTMPGVFSAEKNDPGSAALASLLPQKLPGNIADLGAGWGFLTRAILQREGVISVDVVEADHTALECSKTVTPKHPPRLSVIVSFMVSRICHFARVFFFLGNSQAPPTFECYCQFYGESNLPFCACFFLSCLNSVAPG